MVGGTLKPHAACRVPHALFDSHIEPWRFGNRKFAFELNVLPQPAVNAFSFRHIIITNGEQIMKDFWSAMRLNSRT